MPLIDISYFIGERNIPNTSYPDVSSLIDNLVVVHEREYLISLLGYELFKLFEAGLLDNPVAQKWLDIRDGVVYTGMDGRVKQWRGFVNASTFESPVADYVYYWYVRNNQSQTAAMGEVKSGSENAFPVSSAYKQSKAWNDMAEKSYSLYEFLQLNYATYPEFQLQSGRSELRNILTKINAYNL